MFVEFTLIVLDVIKKIGNANRLIQFFLTYQKKKKHENKCICPINTFFLITVCSPLQYCPPPPHTHTHVGLRLQMVYLLSVLHRGIAFYWMCF